MYFIDRANLGFTLAGGLPSLRGRDAVILCLKEESLLTCITMAMRLRAWIYPLIYEIVHNPDDESMPIGAIDQDGDFCRDPAFSESEMEYLSQDYNNVIEDRKRKAMHGVNQQLIGYGTALDKHILNGRDLIITGDIVTAPLQLSIVQQLLKSLTPKNIFGVAGNVTPDVSDLFHLASNETRMLDVLSGIVFDDDHYFEKADTYTTDQKRMLAVNITTYWQ